MTTPDDAFADDAFTTPDAIENAPDDTALSLFDGDDGMLTLEQRRCLVVMLKHQIITDEREEWPVLCATRASSRAASTTCSSTS
ncbi:hypothetical protein ACFONK_17005 [Microbacterium barkeri]|uniref:hypothetical protein n=1 Tax=Microbacterium barkeri TaxID=33917 RepID=UPI0036080876